MDIKAGIFDMDGTLLDSMGYWNDLYKNYLLSQGIQPDPELLRRVDNMTSKQGIEYLSKVISLPHSPKEILSIMLGIIEQNYQNDVVPKPGAEEYLISLQEKGCPMCVITATNERLAKECLERLNLAQYFEFIWSCDSFSTSKHEPDIFFMAAERMGATASETAVFEDAPYSARTAHAAGFYTVGIYDVEFDPDWPEMQEMCDKAIQSWTELVQPAVLA